MDHYSILDHSTTPQQEADSRTADVGMAELRLADPRESDMTQMGANRSAQGSVSTVMAALNGLSAAPAAVASMPRYPGDDAGRSLADMAQRDLDAALQLLVERAQYITGATGAAIALRRGGYNDMLCRASTGPNAPELGALLSAEYGLSGESVRTRLPLRCDDAESDARVNREGCRQLGVASVAVMPIVSDDKVLGVFELFSGKVNAFEERDLAALQRLGEMVETAVRLAQAAQGVSAEVMGEFVAEVSEVEPDVEIEAAAAMPAAAPAPRIEQPLAMATAAAASTAAKPLPVEPPVTTPVKKPLLWSAATQPPARPPESDQSHVPPALRNLRKCQACGFPVSEGRTLCVDCEEKQWRGQLRMPAPESAKPSAVASSPATAPALSVPSKRAEDVVSTPADKTAPERVISLEVIQPAPPTVESSARSASPSSVREESVTSSPLPEAGETSASTLPFLTAGVTSSESWLSANKYILAAVVAVAVALVLMAVLR